MRRKNKKEATQIPLKNAISFSKTTKTAFLTIYKRIFICFFKRTAARLPKKSINTSLKTYPSMSRFQK